LKLAVLAIAERSEMCSVDAAAFEAASWESQAVAELHLLNASWVRAFADSDAAWYSEHLHDGLSREGRRPEP
jgi:hypothetical protein